jgi:hypothetical protein
MVCSAKVAAHVFSRPTHRFIRDGVNDLECHHLVGVEWQGPWRVACRRSGAGQGAQLGFAVAVELSGPRRMRTLFAVQSGFQAVSNQRFSGPLHGQPAHSKGFANVLVWPGWALCALIGFE